MLIVKSCYQINGVSKGVSIKNLLKVHVSIKDKEHQKEYLLKVYVS